MEDTFQLLIPEIELRTSTYDSESFCGLCQKPMIRSNPCKGRFPQICYVFPQVGMKAQPVFNQSLYIYIYIYMYIYIYIYISV